MKQQLTIVLTLKSSIAIFLLIWFIPLGVNAFVVNNVFKSDYLQMQDQQSISGTVTDEEGVPIPGVNITVEGNNASGVTTDFDGKYEITASLKATIIFEYIGYETKKEKTEGRSIIDITLKESQESLDEVLVVGYGTQAKRDLTGSVSIVEGEEINSRNTSNISQALQGSVPGLSVTRGGSAPGSGATLRIRGETTLEGDSNPLILVDDVPVKNIDDVNPNDVASVSVLKDGAASAIYGSKAAAGVIIITTKSAKEGKFRADYNGEFLVNIPTQIRRPVSVKRYMEMYNEAIWNDNRNVTNEYNTYAREIIENYEGLNKLDPNNYPDTDWRSLLLSKHSITHRHHITLSAGSERVKTFASFGYEYQDALYKNRDWNRYTGRVKNNLVITNNFGANLNLSFNEVDFNRPLADYTEDAIKFPQIYPALWDDGRIAKGKDGTNPYATLHQGGEQQDEQTKVDGKFELYFKPYKGIKISMNVSPYYEFRRHNQFSKSISYWDANDRKMEGDPNYITSHKPSQRNLQENYVTERRLTSQALVNYDTTFVGKHNINSVLGYEQQSQKIKGIRVRGEEFDSNDFPYLNQAPKDKVFDNGSDISELSYSSYFGRASYNYDSKYYIQGTVRRDGSSRFAKDYRWGTFPSVALGWELSREGFMKSLSSWVDYLKLRVSYGNLGNDRLGNYLYISTLKIADAYIANGAKVETAKRAAQRFLEIEDITWETTTSWNLGVDFSTLNNRLSLTGEYFKKDTKDMLLALNIPALTGFDDPTVNVGNMNTEGWEVSANWRDNIGDMKYSISVNTYDNKSIIGDVADKRLFSGNKLSEEGIEFKSWYGYKSNGLYQTQEEVDNSAVISSSVGPGDIKYEDINGSVEGDNEPNGEINENDKTVLGGSLPRYQFGGNLTLEYRGFDFNLSFQGVGKQNFYLNPNKYIMAFDGNFKSPPQLLDGNYWSVYNSEEENRLAKYPRLGNNNKSNNVAFSDFWLRDGSYLRIKNITIGYTLPSNISDKIGTSRARVYLSGNDIFTFDNLPTGVDPEQNGTYLITKSYLIGLNLSL